MAETKWDLNGWVLNILVRFLTAAHKKQNQLALNIIKNQAEIFITKTVMLEFEWVVRAAYKAPKRQLATELSAQIWT